MQNSQLQKPIFIKLIELEKARSGYNVYLKVLSKDKKEIETRDGQKISSITALLGDQTAVASFYFRGNQQTKHIIEGQVVAIRNGTKKIIKNKMSLSIDDFGRVTPQNLDFKVSESAVKLNDKQYQQQRRNYGNKYHRFNGPFNRRQQPYYQNNNQKFYGNGTNNQRTYRRRDNYNYKNQQYDNNDHNQSSYNNNRSFYNNNKSSYRSFNNRNRQNNRYVRDYDRDFDRGNKNVNYIQKSSNQQSKYNHQKTTSTLSKINKIQPGDESIRIIVKVLQVKQAGKMLNCIVADDSGYSKAFLPNYPFIDKGKSIAILGAQAQVNNQHIQLILANGGRIQQARRELNRTNDLFNLSAKAWVPVPSEK